MIHQVQLEASCVLKKHIAHVGLASLPTKLAQYGSIGYFVASLLNAMH